MALEGTNSDIFVTESGEIAPAVSAVEFSSILDRLVSEFGFKTENIYEAASLSMAMVARFSLGSYAKNGKVLSIVTDSLAGLVSLATLRHLCNGGAHGQIVLTKELEDLSCAVRREVSIAQKMGISVVSPEIATRNLNEFHCVLLGLFGAESDRANVSAELFESINDLPLPVHSVVAPWTSNPQDPGNIKIYSASTLSMGFPLQELNITPELVGRTFLCDICIPKIVYSAYTQEGCSLFSKQPVIKINLV